MKKLTSIAIAILILCTFTVCFTACGNTTSEPETTTISETIVDSETTTKSPTANLDFLHDYNQDASLDEGQWKIGEDIYFIDGKFYSTNNEIIFNLASISEDIDPWAARLVGCSTSSDGTNYIICKCYNNIWLIKENNKQFKYELIADDAVWDYEMLRFPGRGDRFVYFCNNDAVQYGRSVIYRCEDGGLVQVDIWNDGVITKNTFESENPVLITDYSGVYWLQVEDFEVYEITELRSMAQDPENHPEHYITRDGVLENLKLDNF